MFTRPKEIAPLQIARAMPQPYPSRAKLDAAASALALSPRARPAAGSTSGRRPLNEGARRVPVRVHSANSTWATSRGSTKTVPLGGWRPSNGESSRRSGSSSRMVAASVSCGEAGAHLAGVQQAPIRRGRRRPARRAWRSALPSPGEPAADHDLLRRAVLDLDPRRRAAARLVRASPAAWPRSPRAPAASLASSSAAPSPSRCAGARQLGPSSSSSASSLRRSRVGQRQGGVALQPEQVEDHVGHRHVAHPPLHRGGRGQVHPRLEPLEARPATRVEGHDLAVEDECAASPAPRPARGPPGSGG